MMQMKGWIRRIIFIIGLCICLYPFASRALNYLRIQHDFQTIRADKVREQKLAAKLDKNAGQPLMTEFTTSNLKGKLADQLLGSIEIPTLKVALPLFSNVSDAALNRGAGVLPGSGAPTGGKGKHSVISAHAGLPGKEFFSNLHRLKKGAQFLITIGGKTRAYEVDAVHTVLPTDTQLLKRVAGKDLVTLLTCTPVPANTHRLLVRGHRVPYTPALAARAAKASKSGTARSMVILAGIFWSLLTLLGYAIGRRRATDG
jgi:sortase A